MRGDGKQRSETEGAVIAVTTREAWGDDASDLRSGFYHKLGRVVEQKRPMVVSTWPTQARRSLEAMGWARELASVAHLATESECLLSEIARRLMETSQPPRNVSACQGETCQYALLNANAVDSERAAEVAMLLQLHRSLLHFVWALVLPDIAASLSAEKVTLARAALSRVAREVLRLAETDIRQGKVR